MIRRTILTFIGLLVLMQGTALAQDCWPRAISGTGTSFPYYVVVDGEQRSRHSREATAIDAARDSLALRPGATVHVQSVYRMECGGSPVPPDTAPAPPDSSSSPPDTVVIHPPGAQLPAPSSGTLRLIGVDPRLPTGDARYDSLVARYGAYHDSLQQSRDPGDGWPLTYYDRGLGAYHTAQRTGDPAFLEWAWRSIVEYRDDYVLKNDGAVAPKWHFPEGLAVHYRETGDTLSRRAVVRMADRISSWVVGKDTSTTYRDGRIQGRAALAQAVAFELTGEEKYAHRAREGVRHLLTWYDSAGAAGAWDSGAMPIQTPWTYDEELDANGDTIRVPKPPYSGLASYCDGMATFQIAHAILYALARHDELVEDVPRLEEVFTETLDRIWELAWVEGEGFRYIIPPRPWLDENDLDAGDRFACPNSGSSDVGKDLDLLIATSFAYGYAITGEERFRERARAAWALGTSGSVAHPKIFWRGYKQHNESTMRAARIPSLLGDP